MKQTRETDRDSSSQTCDDQKRHPPKTRKKTSTHRRGISIFPRAQALAATHAGGPQAPRPRVSTTPSNAASAAKYPLQLAGRRRRRRRESKGC